MPGDVTCVTEQLQESCRNRYIQSHENHGYTITHCVYISHANPQTDKLSSDACSQHHQQNFQKDADDPTRCDNVIRANNITSNDIMEDSTVLPLSSDESSDSGQTMSSEVPLIQFPVGPLPPASLRSLASRKGTSLSSSRRHRMNSYVIQDVILDSAAVILDSGDVSRPRNLVHVQDDWNRQDPTLHMHKHRYQLPDSHACTCCLGM